MRSPLTRWGQLLALGMLGIVFTALLAACTGTRQSPIAQAEAPGAFKVAILLPGPISDRAWNQSAYEGLQLMQQQLGAQVTYAESVPEAEAGKLFRQYAHQDFDLLISHGVEYLAAAEKVAQEFPRTKFAVVSSYAGNNQNFGALAFRSGEVGYLTGAVAALKTQTNKIAYIGGQRYPITLEEATLWERGALATNPQVSVSVHWVNSWSDVKRAKEIAQAQIAAGADMLVVDADRANQGVIEVAAKHQGVYVIDWRHAIAQLPNPSHPQSKVILTSVVQQVPMLLLEGATLVQQGRWEGKQYKFGFLERVQDLAPFHGLLTPEQESYVKTLKQRIIAGKIDVSP